MNLVELEHAPSDRRARRVAGSRLGGTLALSLLAVACAAGSAGEATFVGASLEEQEASFAPYREREKGGQALADHLAERTLWIVSGIDFHAGQSPGDVPAVFGAAAALSADGYLLTATHNADRSPIYVLLPYEGRGECAATERSVPLQVSGRVLVARRARTVWGGGTSVGGTDLSILALDTELGHHFERWAGLASLREGEPVVSAGWPLPSSGLEGLTLDEFTLGLAAGPLLEAGRAGPAGAVITIFGFVHRTPLRVGYSGGPLTNLDAELIGVNVRVRETEGGLQSVALAPHRHWLEEMIARDRRSRTSAPTNASGAERKPSTHAGEVADER